MPILAQFCGQGQSKALAIGPMGFVGMLHARVRFGGVLMVRVLPCLAHSFAGFAHPKPSAGLTDRPGLVRNPSNTHDFHPGVAEKLSNQKRFLWYEGIMDKIPYPNVVSVPLVDTVRAGRTWLPRPASVEQGMARLANQRGSARAARSIIRNRPVHVCT